MSLTQNRSDDYVVAMKIDLSGSSMRQCKSNVAFNVSCKICIAVAGTKVCASTAEVNCARRDIHPNIHTRRVRSYCQNNSSGIGASNPAYIYMIT